MDNATLEAYVDGSFNENGISGAVVLPSTGEDFYFFASEPSLSVHRNVSGEVLATLLAATLACQRASDELVIFHDYTGLAEWYHGHWKARSPLAKFYVDHLHLLATRCSLKLEFRKVRAHAGDQWNNYVDKLAKNALKRKESNVDISDLLRAFRKYTDNT